MERPQTELARLARAGRGGPDFLDDVGFFEKLGARVAERGCDGVAIAKVKGHLKHFGD